MQQQQERSNNMDGIAIIQSPDTLPLAHKALLAVANWPHKFPRRPPSPLSGVPPFREIALGEKNFGNWLKNRD